VRYPSHRSTRSEGGSIHYLLNLLNLRYVIVKFLSFNRYCILSLFLSGTR